MWDGRRSDGPPGPRVSEKTVKTQDPRTEERKKSANPPQGPQASKLREEEKRRGPTAAPHPTTQRRNPYLDVNVHVSVMQFHDLGVNLHTFGVNFHMSGCEHTFSVSTFTYSLWILTLAVWRFFVPSRSNVKEIVRIHINIYAIPPNKITKTNPLENASKQSRWHPLTPLLLAPASKQRIPGTPFKPEWHP